MQFTSVSAAAAYLLKTCNEEPFISNTWAKHVCRGHIKFRWVTVNLLHFLSCRHLAVAQTPLETTTNQRPVYTTTILRPVTLCPAAPAGRKVQSVGLISLISGSLTGWTNSNPAPRPCWLSEMTWFRTAVPKDVTVVLSASTSSFPYHKTIRADELRSTT